MFFEEKTTVVKQVQAQAVNLLIALISQITGRVVKANAGASDQGDYVPENFAIGSIRQGSSGRLSDEKTSENQKHGAGR
jgi:hypothetical protein